MTSSPPQLDPKLKARLLEVALDPEDFGDPGRAWRTLHARFGRRITLVDRYTLEATSLGVRIAQLDSETRERLTSEVLRIRYPHLTYQAGSGRSVRDPIEVVDYDPRWPEQFSQWRMRLAEAFAPAAPRIEHVGSTSVPGLPAKPVIDIQVSVPDVEDEPRYVPAIERAGVPLRIREPGHRYFRPAGDRPRDVQIHVCDVGSAWEHDHLSFRDSLRSSRDVRDAYAALKRSLAIDFRDDRLAYNEAKTEFILDALESATRCRAHAGATLPSQPKAP